MSEATKTLSFLTGILALSMVARADMTNTHPAGIECRQVAFVADAKVEAQFAAGNPGGRPSVLVVGPWNEPFVPEAGGDSRRISEIQRPQILTDGQSSLNLCLSALISLGLCSGAHCLKKLHPGFTFESYHNGGPFQIGHSLAVDPDSICPAPVCAFIQPVRAAEVRAAQYRLGTILSHWRKSQFTASALARRGPPGI